MKIYKELFQKKVEKLLPKAECIYKDLHQYPEVSLHEEKTAEKIAKYLKEYGFKVIEHLGGTGVVGILKNGEGHTVMLRSDMDALPMQELTGLPYASTAETVNDKGEVVFVSHACGHDMHMTWLLACAELYATSLDAWQGTLVVLFQPAEEVAKGSQAMIEDGLIKKIPKPDVIFGQHLLQFRAGSIGYKAGQLMTAGDSLLVRFYGRGGHGGMPHQGTDPLVMAASAVVRLQTIVSREVSPQEQAVVTIGEFHAGTAENIIPDEAFIKINVRTANEQVREHVLTAIKRICIAEAQASNAPKEPTFEVINNFPITINDNVVTNTVAEAFIECFGKSVFETPPIGASEDFGRFGKEWGVPYMFWFVGGTDPIVYDRAVNNNTVGQLPGPHSPLWAPVLHPTLKTGIETMLIAAGLWLKKTK